MEHVRDAVEQLDTLEETYSPVLIGLGRGHPPNVNFKLDDITLFIQSVLSVWKSVLQEKMTSECIEAWRTLFVFILTSMRKGKLDRNRENRV